MRGTSSVEFTIRAHSGPVNAASRVPVLIAMVVVAGLVSACAARSGGRERPGQVLVVLLPDTDTGNVGRVVVSNPEGSTELASAWASTRVTLTQAPQIRTLRESDVRQRFGDVLATLPPPPRHFTLPFRFDSEELTDEGRRLVQDVLQAVKTFPVPDVVVIGHTDTTGSRESNIELGLRRANAVRALLAQAGLTPATIDARSHGEAELLVPTGDSVFEPRNRRVDVTVR
jgi:outer membrane protein OmpA-like peptidoglycan-associated protein